MLVIDVQGARQVRGRGIETVGVFVLPPSAGVLESRLRGRSKDTEEQILRRLAVARTEVGEYAQYQYVVVNDDLDGAVEPHARHRDGGAGAGEGDARRGRDDHRDVPGQRRLMALIALGVTGGIGAYKAVEVCRGLQKRGHDVQAVMTRSARAVRGAADLRGHHPAAGDHVAVAARHERRHRAHRDGRSRRPAARGAVHGQRHRQVRQRHRRRLPHLALSRDAGAGAAGAGHELQHAGARGGAGRTSRRCSGAASGSSSRARATWRAAGWARGGWPSPTTSSRRPSACWLARPRRPRPPCRRPRRRTRFGAARPQGPDHRRADLRRHRPGALRRQPVERPHGVRARRGSQPPRRRGDAGGRPDHGRRRRPPARWCACAAPPRCTRR